MNINLSVIDNSVDKWLDVLTDRYDVVHTFDVSQYKADLLLLQQELLRLHKDVFFVNERIIFTIQEDVYNHCYGVLLKSIQTIVNAVDISNSFIVILTTNENVISEYRYILDNYNTDLESFEIFLCDGDYHKHKSKISEYDSYNVIKTHLSDYALRTLNNNAFCILPWIQLQIDNNNNVYPCCYSDRNLPVSSYSLNTNDMGNSQRIRILRVNMLSGVKNVECNKCWINEENDRTSHRMYANHNFSHLVDKTQQTLLDGTVDFSMIAWNLQFDNLCNLKCRTCSSQASTSWINDSKKLGYPIPKAISDSSAIIDHHLKYINEVEQIYFAGGEPLIIDAHYVVLDELLKQNRIDVEITYNTNFTQLAYKGKSIFDYWEKFDSVSVGASLDAMGDKAEYWRSGTKWDIIEQNRLDMINSCPSVSFEVTPTVSLVNALHIVDFHKEWTERGLITADQFNLKFLLTPSMFSIIQAPAILKRQIKEKYEKHLEWLIPLDSAGKATNDYRSMINALTNDSEFDYDGFWKKINEVDNIRNEKLLDIFPELECLK